MIGYLYISAKHMLIQFRAQRGIFVLGMQVLVFCLEMLILVQENRRKDDQHQ